MQYLVGIGFGILAMLGFGLANTFLILAAKKYGAIKAAFLIFMVICIASIIPAFWLFTFGGFTPLVILLLIVTGIISFVGFASFSKGFEVGSASVVAPIAGSWSVVTIILSILLLGEHLTILGTLEILLIIVGVILISIKYSDLKRLNFSKAGDGAVYGVITMISWGLFFFLTAVIVFKIGWFDTAFILDIITVVLFFSYGVNKKVKLLSISNWWGYKIFLVTGLAQLIATFAYNIGITLNFVSVISPITSSSVMIPVIFSILFLKEKPEKTRILGIVMAIIGIVALALQGY